MRVPVLLASAALMLAASCSCGPSQCSTSSRICGQGCCDTWTCERDVYEIRCHLDGGSGCACIRNGATEREFTFNRWCSGDVPERTNSANSSCGWALPNASR